MKVGDNVEAVAEQMDAGMNAGIAPILLPPNQLAFARNSTMRGGFPLPRAPYQTITLNYNGSSAVQDAIENGLLQGVCYYSPSGGYESIMASISGRLYQFIIVAGVATVIDQTGSNPQSATASQCWLWQSEKWVIWNDGENLPVFFDGNSTRRSQGPATSLGTTTAAVTVGVVGTIYQFVLNQAYSGPINVPVNITGTNVSGLFLIVSTGAVSTNFQVTLKTLYKGDTTEAAGTNLVTKPNTMGIITAPTAQFFVGRTTGVNATVFIPIPGASALDSVAVNTTVQIGPYTGRYQSRSQGSVVVFFPPNGVSSYSVQVSAGMVFTVPSITAPNVTVGTIATGSPYTVPAVGSSGTVNLASAYTGALNAIVYDGNSEFQVTAVAGSSGSSTTINAQQISSIPGSTSVPSGSTVTSLGELPAGRMGAYGLGRNWMALTDGRSYIGGDIVGGSSGTPPYNKLDSVLKITENSYLAGGGVFTVPGAVGDIRSMRFTAMLDTSLGQGPLMVGTPTTIFSCNAPIDRTKWMDMINPIQTQALIAAGPLSQDATIVANSDILFRQRKGISSLILGKREFATWGNTSISNEIRPTIQDDDVELLPFASAIDFDNRLLMTLTPTNTARGVAFSQLAVINFDPISGMRGKDPSIYDGIWDGLNVLKLVTGKFNEVDRAFALVLTEDNKIGLTEILSTDSGVHFDNNSTNPTRIVQTLELPVLMRSNEKPRPLFRLKDGEIYCDLIDGNTIFDVSFRPDYSTTYNPWYMWQVANPPNYQPAMGLGDPGNSSNDADKSNREGYYFQVQVKITGYARFMGCRLRATVVPMPDMPTPMNPYNP